MIHTLKTNFFPSLLFPLLISLAIVGCHNTTQPATTDSNVVASQSPQLQTPLSQRERLVLALEQLQKDIAGKNKQTIAAYFRFPVPSDDLQALNINEAFDTAVEQNNYQISQQLFNTHFSALYNNLEMQGLTEMFAHLPLSKLKDTATKQIQASRAEKICLHSYNIIIEGKEVTLEYGVNTNEAYTAKHLNEELECGEYAAFWTFTFDGEKLIFSRHQVAG